MWFIFAILSAIFAALTSILAKIGIEGVNSNLATAVRTIVVVLMAWLMVFIKQCKNTRDSSTRRVLVMRHVLVEYELHEDFSKHIGKLVCRHRVKLCNEETELLGTLKASITTTQ